MCHDHGEALRAPALATLKGMRYQQIYYALTAGKMQATGRCPDRRPALGPHRLPYRQGAGERRLDVAAALHPGAPQGRSQMPATVADFGFDLQNHRHLTAQQAGITTADFSHMQLAWALRFHAHHHARAIGHCRHHLVPAGCRCRSAICHRHRATALPEMDIQERCAAAHRRWLRGNCRVSHRKVLVFADVGTRIHMVDAATGAPLWKHAVHLTSLSNTTGTPVLLGGRVYVPLSASEINVGADARHLCCTTHARSSRWMRRAVRRSGRHTPCRMPNPSATAGMAR